MSICVISLNIFKVYRFGERFPLWVKWQEERKRLNSIAWLSRSNGGKSPPQRLPFSLDKQCSWSHPELKGEVVNSCAHPGKPAATGQISLRLIKNDGRPVPWENPPKNSGQPFCLKEAAQTQCKLVLDMSWLCMALPWNKQTALGKISWQKKVKCAVGK